MSNQYGEHPRVEKKERHKNPQGFCGRGGVRMGEAAVTPRRRRLSPSRVEEDHQPRCRVLVLVLANASRDC